jgi:putative spermidine/putrescine transport system permease protein
MTRLAGWLAVALLLTPLGMALWASFTPSSLFAAPTGQWSLRWYREFASDPRWMAALGRSLALATASSAVAVCCGGTLAFAVARHRFAGRSLFLALAVAPALIPPAVLGMGMLPLFFATRLYGHPAGLALAHAALGLPVACLVLRAHFESAGAMLEDAARGLGATAWQAFCRVTLPLALPSSAAAGLGAFVLSLNESMVTVFLATPDTQTLPALVWPSLRDSASPLVAVASAVSVAAGLVAIALVARHAAGLGSHRGQPES